MKELAPEVMASIDRWVKEQGDKIESFTVAHCPEWFAVNLQNAKPGFDFDLAAKQADFEAELNRAFPGVYIEFRQWPAARTETPC